MDEGEGVCFTKFTMPQVLAILVDIVQGDIVDIRTFTPRSHLSEECGATLQIERGLQCWVLSTVVLRHSIASRGVSARGMVRVCVRVY